MPKPQGVWGRSAPVRACSSEIWKPARVAVSLKVFFDSLLVILSMGRARQRLQHLTSHRLSERSERSELGATPQRPSTAEQSGAAGPPPSGRLFFGDFLLAKQKKVTRLSGRNPDAASRSEQDQAKAKKQRPKKRKAAQEPPPSPSCPYQAILSACHPSVPFQGWPSAIRCPS